MILYRREKGYKVVSTMVKEKKGKLESTSKNKRKVIFMI